MSHARNGIEQKGAEAVGSWRFSVRLPDSVKDRYKTICFYNGSCDGVLNYWELNDGCLRDNSNVLIFQRFGSVFFPNIGIFISVTNDDSMGVALHFGDIRLSRRYHSFETRFHQFVINDDASEPLLKKGSQYWICYFDQTGFDRLTLRSSVGSSCPFGDLIRSKPTKRSKVVHGKKQIPGSDPVDVTEDVKSFIKRSSHPTHKESSGMSGNAFSAIIADADSAPGHIVPNDDMMIKKKRKERKNKKMDGVKDVGATAGDGVSSKSNKKTSSPDGLDVVSVKTTMPSIPGSSVLPSPGRVNPRVTMPSGKSMIEKAIVNFAKDKFVPVDRVRSGSELDVDDKPPDHEPDDASVCDVSPQGCSRDDGGPSAVDICCASPRDALSLDIGGGSLHSLFRASPDWFFRGDAVRALGANVSFGDVWKINVGDVPRDVMVYDSFRDMVRGIEVKMGEMGGIAFEAKASIPDPSRTGETDVVSARLCLLGEGSDGVLALFGEKLVVEAVV